MTIAGKQVTQDASNERNGREASIKAGTGRVTRRPAVVSSDMQPNLVGRPRPVEATHTMLIVEGVCEPPPPLNTMIWVCSDCWVIKMSYYSETRAVHSGKP